MLDAESPILSNAYGSTRPERLYNAAMELCIIWINRILFLKLLEAQLLNYHRGDAAYRFLTYDKIPDFDGLNRLFFQVMGTEPSRRNAAVNALFPNVPYLNSSLFERSALERDCISISGLEQSEAMPLMQNSVLHADARFARKTTLPFIEYLFAFLDAYNFSSEGSGDVAEQPKTLINAAVLGLIFEKINGYREGSVFTPGFITNYICQTALRQAVIRKFNKHYGWNLTEFSQLLDADFDRHEANDLINSLTICDPAVGSGHFLVSALNEIILIKAQLGCLFDCNARRIKPTDYEISVENDELIILDSEHDLWTYNPNLTESRRIQQAIFNEKQLIIKNCLFGVDINRISVNICRLRLWIELLKNAYYTPESNYTQLETLPNIDINIKCGNSVLHKFALTDPIPTNNLVNYRAAVRNYKQTRSKEDKAEVAVSIAAIKDQIVHSIIQGSPLMKKLLSASSTYHNLVSLDIGSLTPTLRRRRQKEIKAAKTVFDKAQKAVDNARLAAARFAGGFEWRVEFPEVLNADGSFRGFDLVIGNPPYISVEGISTELKQAYKDLFNTVFKRSDLFGIFIEQSLNITTPSGIVMLIVPSVVHSNLSYSKLRDLILANRWLAEVCYTGGGIFDAATVDTTILRLDKASTPSILLKDARNFASPVVSYVPADYFSTFSNIISIDSRPESQFDASCFFRPDFDSIDSHFTIFQGIVTGCNPAFIFGSEPDALAHVEPELLHPVCFGRNVSRYEPPIQSSRIAYLNNGVDINDFPLAESWLSKLKEKLERRREVKKNVIKWYSLQWPRIKADLDVKEKILVQNTRNESLKTRIVATLDSEGIYATQGINFIIPKDDKYSLHYLLGVLNSRIVNELFATKFLNLGIKADYLKQVRIPPYSPQIDALVRHVLHDKALGIDTAPLEAQIDALIAQSYSLR